MQERCCLLKELPEAREAVSANKRDQAADWSRRDTRRYPVGRVLDRIGRKMRIPRRRLKGTDCNIATWKTRELKFLSH